MTTEETKLLISFGQSHLMPIPKCALGVTKFQVFLALKPLLKGKEYWEALADAFNMTDNLFLYKYDVLLAFL